MGTIDKDDFMESMLKGNMFGRFPIGKLIQSIEGYISNMNKHKNI